MPPQFRDSDSSYMLSTPPHLAIPVHHIINTAPLQHTPSVHISYTRPWFGDSGPIAGAPRWQLLFFFPGLFRPREGDAATSLLRLLLRRLAVRVRAAGGKRLGPASAARSSTRSSAGPSLGPGSGAAGQAQPKAVLATASWTWLKKCIWAQTTAT